MGCSGYSNNDLPKEFLTPNQKSEGTDEDLNTGKETGET
jgi:hypothetical protein